MDAGFPSVTKYSVAGRGKQRGIKIGQITYDEIPKTMLMSVVKAEDKEFVVDTIMASARSGKKGAFGDGKIFVSEVEDVYTISSGVMGHAPRKKRRPRHERGDRRGAHEHHEPDQKGPDQRPA